MNPPKLQPSLFRESPENFYSPYAPQPPMKRAVSSLDDVLDRPAYAAHPHLVRRISDSISSEISLDNLVEGSRRKRNKFSSSSLPLLPLPNGSAGPTRRNRARTDSGASVATPGYVSGRVSFPTPAPTTISDEDVAMQLIRLGDPQLSPFKCPSEKSNSPIPAPLSAHHFRPYIETFVEEPLPTEYPSSPPSSVTEYAVGGSNSTVQEESVQGAFDEEEKPLKNGRSIGVRCTRCKKSKKGCDRQRPCGRCKDAGEECVTEDEGTGNRGKRGGRGRNRKR